MKRTDLAKIALLHKFKLLTMVLVRKDRKETHGPAGANTNFSNLGQHRSTSTVIRRICIYIYIYIYICIS